MAFKRFEDYKLTHDCNLPQWGPYSKRYAGVSHINDNNRGKSFDLSVFPGKYRGILDVPSELYQSNFYPWYALPDLSYYKYRFELEWKDKFYTDISYITVDENSKIIKIDCVNNTDIMQNLCLHYVASMQYPTYSGSKDYIAYEQYSTKGDNVFIDAVLYDELSVNTYSPQDYLTYDGRFRCEVVMSGATNGRALGERFGKAFGDCADYSFNSPKFENAVISLRAKGKADFSLSGITDAILSIDSDNFTIYTINIGAVVGGEHKLKLNCLSGEGVLLDCIIISAAGDLPQFKAEELGLVPEIITDKTNSNQLILKYPSSDYCYGIAWQGDSSVIRQFFCSDWDDALRKSVHNHVSTEFYTDSKAHYTDVFVRPVFMQPNTSFALYGGLFCGNFDEVKQKLSEFSLSSAEKLAIEKENALPKTADDKYNFSQQIMQATLLTNVVYPVYVQGKYIRHFTPGKWWDCLYTWDSGFIALGFSDISIELALDCLNCYLTEEGNRHAAFIHHGSMVPVQAYVYKVLFDKTQNIDYLREFYPRLRQYYRFFVGRNGISNTRRLKSALINTFSYFYNSGGWDDYPPQQYLRDNALFDEVSPIVNSAHVINFAKILKFAAKKLNIDDIDEYDADIKELTEKIQTLAYDEESGYFGYVTHDKNGNPSGILRYQNSVNFNMGLDGAYPFMAGICTKEQRETLVSYIMSSDRMWTDIGISTVDKSAPYYTEDGYWNGAVWMAHQWFVFEAMLDYGYAEYALKTAKTALDVWKREVEYSYNSYEHFVSGSGRGAGWHHFGGLSAPVVNWYNAVLSEGNITVSNNTWVLHKQFNDDFTALNAEVCSENIHDGKCSIFVTMKKGKQYKVMLNGLETKYKQYENAIIFGIDSGTQTKIEIM